MKPEIKKKWVDALRSGEYAQTKYRLARTEPGNDSLSEEEQQSPGYCCLGVLCEIALKEGVRLEVTEEDGIRYYDDEEAILPIAVREWAGLVSSNPVLFKPSSEPILLASANDNGTSFEEIADIIEGNERV